MFKFDKNSEKKNEEKATVIIANCVFTLKEEEKKDIFKKRSELSWDSPLYYDYA